MGEAEKEKGEERGEGDIVVGKSEKERETSRWYRALYCFVSKEQQEKDREMDKD